MAEFGLEATQLPAAQGRGTAPLAPVQRQATSYTIPQGIMEVGVGYLQQQARDNEKENPILKNLNSQLFALDRAQTEGRMGYDEAYKRRRALTAQALNAAGGNVETYDSIKKLYNSYSEMTSFEEGVDARKATKEQQGQIRTAMMEKGFYVNPNGSEKYYEDMGQFLASINKAEADFQQKQNKLSYNAQEYGLNQKVLEDQTKAAVQDWVRDNTVPVSNMLFSTVTDLKASVDSGQMSFEDAKFALRESMRVPQEQLTAIAASHPEAARGLRDYLGNLTKDMEDILLDPNTTLEGLERAIKVRELQAQTVMMADDNIVGAVAMTNLLKNNPAALAMVNASVIKAFSDVASPMRGKDGIKALGDVMESPNAKEAVNILKTLARDYSTTDDKTAVDNTINGFLGHGARMSPEGDRRFDLSKSRETINFLASNEFAQWRKGGGQLDQQALDGTRQMFENVYLFEVQTPIIQELYKEVSQTKDILSYGFATRASGAPPEVGTKINFLDAYTVDWSTGGIRFDIREIEGISGFTEQAVRDFADTKNKIVPLINNMVRAGANIDGVTSQEYWEANKHHILPVYFSPDFANLKVGDIEDGREYLGGSPESDYSWRTVD